MATWESPKPSSSSSSKPEFKDRYDIFLSFRGLDTRKKFTDHLYNALKHEGFQTFRDDDEIERGEVIKSELLKSIRNSRMSVIVLSKNYSNSTACLLELQTILEQCKKTDHSVLPVFYEVDPWEIKEKAQNLDFGKKKVTVEKLKAWSAALKEVASMAGMVSQNQFDGYEAKFIDKIVAIIKGKLAGKHLRVPDHLVGMDSRTNRVDSWLKDRSTGVGVLVICGMGGIGKTTIAKVLYNSNHGRYDAACFLPNVRETAKGTNGLVRLQRQLLSDIQRKEERKVNDVDDGCRRMKYVLTNKRVLLVLDDVDQADQVFALAGQQDWFMPGSKIIVTTRLESLMNADEIYDVYRPGKLSINDSLELFSWHAFGQSHPIQSHMDLSKRFVHRCDGLPLALQVLGRSVRQRSLDVWESALQKLEAISNSEILEKLEISYDSLKDNHDKNLFLEIACFFAGKKKNDTITILEGCDYSALAGIYNLVDRNLITIENEKLEMHQLLQDLGRQIVCRESTHPEKRSRIWHHMESFNILLEKIGTSEIGGLMLDMNMLRDSNMVVFEANTFENIYNLRLLKLSDVQVSGTYQAFPKRLGWLYWRGFPSEYFPDDFPLEHLVTLDLRYSNLKQLWKGTKALGSLKILNLSHSPKLAKTPDFSRIPSLEKLILKACLSLFEVDESIVKLQRIELLNLRDCKNLRKLPRNISTVESLVEMNISGCSNLMGAIEELEKMKSLRVLHASRMDMDRFFTREVESQGFNWPSVPKPRIQISLAALPSSLTQLNLSHCNLTENAFPEDFSKLSQLQQLFLGGNPVSSLPKAIKDLMGLQMLDLSWCPKLQQILFPPINLEKLVVTECRALEKITFEPSGGIKYISHGACMSLDYVQRGFKILPVKKVDVELINKIGFFFLDSMANVEAYIVNLRVWSRKKCPIQILFETSIFSTYFPGREVPQWFSNRSRGSTVTFTTTHRGTPGLNLCLVYTLPDNLDWLPEPLEVEVINKTRRMRRVYTPSCYGIPEAGGDMVWLSHWLPGWIIFEEGDDVQVLFNLKVDGQIKECGVHLLHFGGEEQVKYFRTIYHSWDPNMFQVVPLEAVKKHEASSSRGPAEVIKTDKDLSPRAPRPSATKARTIRLILGKSDDEGGDEDLTHPSVPVPKDTGVSGIGSTQNEFMEVWDSKEVDKEIVVTKRGEEVLEEERNDDFVEAQVITAEDFDSLGSLAKSPPLKQPQNFDKVVDIHNDFQIEVQDNGNQDGGVSGSMPPEGTIANVQIGIEYYPILEEVERIHPNTFSRLFSSTAWVTRALLAGFASFLKEARYVRVDDLDASRVRTYLIALKEFDLTGIDVSWLRHRFEDAQRLNDIKEVAREIEATEALVVEKERELVQLKAIVAMRKDELANARMAPSPLVDGDLILKDIF